MVVFTGAEACVRAWPTVVMYWGDRQDWFWSLALGCRAPWLVPQGPVPPTTVTADCQKLLLG